MTKKRYRITYEDYGTGGLNALLAADAVRYVDEPTGLYELQRDPRDD